MSRSNYTHWYSEGLRFDCTLCGRCCSGPPGLVEFSQPEGLAMAEHLGLSLQDFLDRHAVRFGDVWALIEAQEKTSDGYDCILLEREPKTRLARCRVYPFRPAQCRTWPFWPENLESPKAWKCAAGRCEGIDRGPRVALEEILDARDRTPGAG